MWKQELQFHVMKKCLWHAGQMECEIASGKEIPRDLGFKMQFQKECKQTSGFQTAWHSGERKDFNWSGLFSFNQKGRTESSSSCCALVSFSLPSTTKEHFMHVTQVFFFKVRILNLPGQKALGLSFSSMKLS